jgi:hypothetical protein
LEIETMQKRKILIGVLVVLAAGGWYAFRPERLFINKRVNESFGDIGTSAPASLAMGQFHSVHHETKGTAAVIRTGDGKRVLRRWRIGLAVRRGDRGAIADRPYAIQPGDAERRIDDQPSAVLVATDGVQHRIS